jgi:hypothetical protein
MGAAIKRDSAWFHNVVSFPADAGPIGNPGLQTPLSPIAGFPIDRMRGRRE